MTGYQVYWSGGGGADSGNMSAGAEDVAVTITGRTPGLTYTITIVALSDHLPSPAVVVMVTLGKPHGGNIVLLVHMYHNDICRVYFICRFYIAQIYLSSETFHVSLVESIIEFMWITGLCA